MLFSRVGGSIMVTEVELPYTLNIISPHWKFRSRVSRAYLLGEVPCFLSLFFWLESRRS